MRSAQVAARTPLRLAQADDVARVVAFLAGEDGGFLTGITIPVNGEAGHGMRTSKTGYAKQRRVRFFENMI